MKKFFVVISLLLFGLLAVNAQTTVEDAHVALIVNIIKYVEWDQVDETFDIVVIGQPKLAESLQKYYSKKMIANKPVAITSDKGSRTDFTGSDVVISSSKKFAGDHLLTINTSGLNSIVNFNQVDDKIKIKINKNLADQSNLKIASQILKIVEIIE